MPGLVGGWLAAHSEYGKLPLDTVFAPACEIAEEGFAVTPKLAAALESERAAGSPFHADIPLFEC